MDKVDGDVQGIAKQRVWSEAEGKRIVAAWRRSGVSRAAFGRRYGIPVHRLYYWLTKAGSRSPVTERGPVQFHPVRVLPDRVDAGGATPRYEADLAERRFLKVDPDHRLVADALEVDWKAKLRRLTGAQETYAQAKRTDDHLGSPRSADITRKSLGRSGTVFPRLSSPAVHGNEGN